MLPIAQMKGIDYLCTIFNNDKKNKKMIDLNTAVRADLESAILEMDLEETLFGGLDAIIAMSTERIRDILIDYVIENDECQF